MLRTTGRHGQILLSTEGGVDQQLERSEHQELRKLLAEVLKTQEAIMHRLVQLEERLLKEKA